MNKPTVFVKSIETWNVKNPNTDPNVVTGRVQATKIVVRDRSGRFHGATNFKTKQ